MRCVKIEGSKIQNREQLHDELQKQLDFPDYYGRNLDALYDMLTSFAEPISFEIINEAELEEHLGHYAKMFLELLEDVKGDGDV